jgi:hypothetical protein
MSVIGGDPHGVSVSDERTFMRWQSAPSPEVARGIWRDILRWLESQPSWVLSDPSSHSGQEVVVRRVEDRVVVEEQRVIVGEDSVPPPEPPPPPLRSEPPSERLSIREISARRPFPLFAPAQVPDEWSCQVWFKPVPGIVVLDYHRDRQTVLSIVEALPAAGVVPSDGPPWEDAVIGGRGCRVRGPTNSWPYCEIRLTRAGTDIGLISLQVQRTQMIRFAEELEPL